MLKNLYHYEIRDTCFKWFQSNAIERKQCATYDDTKSATETVRC